MSDPTSPFRDIIDQMRGDRTADLLTRNPERADCYRCEGAGIHLDYSKHLLNDRGRAALIELSAKKALAQAFTGLVTGEPVNNTEQRPALHTLLRGSYTATCRPRWEEVAETLRRLQSKVEAIHRGIDQGYGGKTLTDVVNIGIGGSDLGPRMVCEALHDAANPMTAHFVSNVDPWDLDRQLAALDPDRTLFVVCSKSFGTQETISNAVRARQWLLDSGIPASGIEQHVLAVTTNLQAAAMFGIPEHHCFPIWDWVGGRYSLWSAIGLAIALSCGWHVFHDLLAGARAMDEHTGSAETADNVPMMMALLEWWHCQLQQCDSHLVLPYAQRLAYLPDFLQQLTMESNGKRVSRDGQPLQQPSAPMLWGSAGTIGQHSYYQLLHQGNRAFTADILLPLTNPGVDTTAHRKLAANALAQSRALLLGRSATEAAALVAERGLPTELAPHLELPGNHSHSLIWFDAVTPQRLGALIAAYEHKTFFLAELLNINAFDQWGVELGKDIGEQILPMLETGVGLEQLDASTAALAQAWRDANSA